MTALVFVARRGRRCWAGEACVHGGRVQAGDRTFRVKQHHYLHEDDVPELVALLGRLAAVLAPLMAELGEMVRRVGAAFTLPWASWQQAVIDHVVASEPGEVVVCRPPEYGRSIVVDLLDSDGSSLYLYDQREADSAARSDVPREADGI